MITRRGDHRNVIGFALWLLFVSRSHAELGQDLAVEREVDPPVLRAHVAGDLELLPLNEDARTLVLAFYDESVAKFQAAVADLSSQSDWLAVNPARLEVKAWLVWDEFFSSWEDDANAGLSGSDAIAAIEYIREQERTTFLRHLGIYAGAGLTFEPRAVVGAVSSRLLEVPEVRSVIAEHSGAIDASLMHWIAHGLPELVEAFAMESGPDARRLATAQQVMNEKTQEIGRIHAIARQKLVAFIGDSEMERLAALFDASRYPTLFVESPAIAAIDRLLSIESLDAEERERIMAEHTAYFASDRALVASILQLQDRWVRRSLTDPDEPYPSEDVAELGLRRNNLVVETCARVRGFFSREALLALPIDLRLLLLYGVEDVDSWWKRG